MKSTEDNNVYSRNVAEWNSLEIASFIHLSDSDALKCVYPQLERIARAIDICVDSISNGGKIIYAGAGTSGRIGVQDVAELRPTYGIDSRMFDYIIAGGDKAIKESVEGAEDSEESAAEMLDAKKLRKGDVVIGITASGTTPFVQGALKYGKKTGAITVAVTNNSGRPVSAIADVAIELLSGPEVIQGSTRMKAGTAQKMVLNIISTAVAIKLGYTHKNTMARMQSWYNEKLKRRALKMLVDEFGITEKEAEQTLVRYSFKIEDAFNYYLNKE